MSNIASLVALATSARRGLNDGDGISDDTADFLAGGIVELADALAAVTRERDEALTRRRIAQDDRNALAMLNDGLRAELAARTADRDVWRARAEAAEANAAGWASALRDGTVVKAAEDNPHRADTITVGSPAYVKALDDAAAIERERIRQLVYVRALQLTEWSAKAELFKMAATIRANLAAAEAEGGV